MIWSINSWILNSRCLEVTNRRHCPVNACRRLLFMCFFFGSRTITDSIIVYFNFSELNLSCVYCWFELEIGYIVRKQWNYTGNCTDFWREVVHTAKYAHVTDSVWMTIFLELNLLYLKSYDFIRGPNTLTTLVWEYAVFCYVS